MRKQPIFFALCWLSAGAFAGVFFVIACAGGPEESIAQQPSDCVSCALTGPMQIAGPIAVAQPVEISLPSAPIRVITADTDPSQMETGRVRLSQRTMEVLEGPFVLTDAIPDQTDNSEIHLFRGDASERSRCQAGSMGKFARIGWVKQTTDVTKFENFQFIKLEGARINIREGELLCADRGWYDKTELTWSGFRPYAQ